MYEKFVYLCDKKGVKPYGVSKATGVSQATLSDWKLGKSVPKQDKLQKIADYFAVDVKYFYEDEESGESYYLDSGAKDIAQKIFESKGLRLLFDAAKDASEDDLKTVHTMLLALKNKEKGND